jgi:hypothetical protein
LALLVASIAPLVLPAALVGIVLIYDLRPFSLRHE